MRFLDCYLETARLTVVSGSSSCSSACDGSPPAPGANGADADETDSERPGL